jgi:hypothetical protein
MNTEDRKRLMRMSENELRAEVARLQAERDEAYSRALEDAAKAVEAAPDFSAFHGGLVARTDVAAAIRALKDGGGT